MVLLLTPLLMSPLVHLASAISFPLPIHLETRTALTSRVANIHLSFSTPLRGQIQYTYGACSALTPASAHHVIGQGHHPGPDRLVWIIPADAAAEGCVSAWDLSGELLGRSEPQLIASELMMRRRSATQHVAKRAGGASSVAMTNASGIDAWGAWFDGVELLQSKNISAVDAGAAKTKEVAIVGAGMSGLMTFLVLTQAGFTNVEIIEASQRLGGRVRTEYLSGGPFNYSYQEMGPMRFPTTITLANETYNVSDHRLVFSLAAEMNALNKHDANLSVDFIPWLQSSPNGLVYRNGIKLTNGMAPTVSQIAKNSSLKVKLAPDASTEALQDKVDEILPGADFFVKMAQNMFKAHREWIGNGLAGMPGDQWSEFAFMVNYLGASLNDTDVVTAGSGQGSFWDELYEGMYFSAMTWRTIDGGLNRLPLSFHPLVDKVTTMNRKVERIRWDAASQRVTLQSRGHFTDTTFQNSSHDYAIISAPFSVVKKWRFLPPLPTTIGNAVNNVPYTAACKVALEFSTRFWEHFPSPIFGSCSTATDIPGIGSVCYPSYNLNGTGPATMLASYISGGEWGSRWVSTPEAEHVAYVLDAMVEIHGEEIRGLYTGKFNRRCWVLDPYESASWASPVVGQHMLYLPEYFKTHNNLIFVGEHTSYTHAWIASALESGIRGGVQLMLELGLVDEAKAAVEKWMARWIDV